MIKAFKFFMLVFVTVFYACGSDSVEEGAASTSITIEASANEVSYGEDVTFTLQNVPEADVVSVHWDFGDGETSDAFVPSHTYRIPDDYTVTASVALSTGETKEYKTLVKVFAAEISSAVRLSIPESLAGIIRYVRTVDIGKKPRKIRLHPLRKRYNMTLTLSKSMYG